MCLSHKGIIAQTDLPMKRPGFFLLHQALCYLVTDLVPFEEIPSDPERIQFLFLVMS